MAKDNQQKQAEAPEKKAEVPTSAPASELEQLRAENARLREEREQLFRQAEQAAGRAIIEGRKAGGTKPEVPPEFRGKKTYRVKQPHYREGRYYEVGELITVVDEVPSRTWELVEATEGRASPALEAPPPSIEQRDADTAI